MEYLPIFAEVKDRPVLVIGGGEIAARKITFLLRAEAKVQIVAEMLMPELAEKVERDRGRARPICRDLRPPPGQDGRGRTLRPLHAGNAFRRQNNAGLSRP